MARNQGQSAVAKQVDSYRGIVIKHGKVAPHVQFVLKNGRVIEGRATILPHGVSTGVTYRGILAQMYHPTTYGDNTND